MVAGCHSVDMLELHILIFKHGIVFAIPMTEKHELKWEDTAFKWRALHESEAEVQPIPCSTSDISRRLDA